MAEERTGSILRSGRKLSPLPRGIEPHPDEGDRPPCEAKIAENVPCPRPATTHYGFGYYCDEHFGAMLSWEEYDFLSLSLHYAKRALWVARIEDIARLEYHVGNAVSELTTELEEKKANAERLQAEADGRGGA